MPILKAQGILTDVTESEDEGEESSGLFSGGLLPNGSILKNAVLPSYNDDLSLISTVSIAELQIFTREETRTDAKTGVEKSVQTLDKINATDLKIRFFNPDTTTKGDIEMAHAVFKARKNLDLLTTEEPVSFVSNDMNVSGSALAFDIKRNRGFLHGPVTATVRTVDTRTSMKLQPANKTLATGTALMAAVTVLTAQDPAKTTTERFDELRPSEAELAALAAETASQQDKLDRERNHAGDKFTEVGAQSEKAHLTMNRFLKAAALTSLIAAPAATAEGDVPRPEVTVDTQETKITSKKGAYFDATEGLLIFLEDVKVSNPQFQLSGANEVKAYMTPRKDDEKDKKSATDKPLPAPDIEKKDQAEPEVPQPDAASQEPKTITPEMAEKMRAAKEASRKAGDTKDDGKGDFGDIRRIVATGTVVVDFTPDDPEKSPVKASARTVIFDIKNEEDKEDMVILRGGSPWIVQDGKPTIVKGDDAYIFIYMKDGDPVRFVTGNQEMFESTFKTPDKSKPGKKSTTR
ncbi:hypothetical protein [Luteolibacter marinus]|uniref:hypothetical protein n=1 Tax=Luteolibacter marinus TaxID=2776705 RepID=UPI001867B717|nr:hypothetical protein [Luteolibacter marinus]